MSILQENWQVVSLFDCDVDLRDVTSVWAELLAIGLHRI
jgi:hypothetical protein